MISRISFIVIILLLLAGSSCRSKRGPKEYIEKDGLHSSKKPSDLAKEFAEGKKKKRAYKKELRRRERTKKKTGYYTQ